MKYIYKAGPSSIIIDIEKKEIILRDQYDQVVLSQNSFEEIVKIWKETDHKCLIPALDGHQPGLRLYDGGLSISCYKNGLHFEVWVPKDDFEVFIQVYHSITEPAIEPCGKILSNGDFLWKGLPQFICPHSTMAALCATFPFVQLVVDDWAFEYSHDRIFICYKQKNILYLSINNFIAALDNWRKET